MSYLRFILLHFFYKHNVYKHAKPDFWRKIKHNMLSIQASLNFHYELKFFSLNLINPLELYVLIIELKAIFSLLTKFINQ